MKFDDIRIGVVLGVFSVLVFVVARTFPVIPGQQFGASLFPLLISVGLFICSVMLVIQGWRARRAGAERPGWPVWLRQPLAVLRFLMVPLALVFYFMAAESLGFLLCSLLLLVVLQRLFGVPWVRAVIVAVVVTMVIHVAFYTVLHVPLPWGVLEPWAW